jgi:hypothetical protein
LQETLKQGKTGNALTEIFCGYEIRDDEDGDATFVSVAKLISISGD